jgi:methyltransferase (TIGR00027 family)
MMVPSLTGQAVAVVRAGLDRPHSAEGDPEAQRLLCRGMRGDPSGRFRPSLIARTRFFDDVLLDAIEQGVRQIVIVGAGYDDRALRFRSRGVEFFEIDHPLTQADKARRLEAMAADLTNLHFVQADLQQDDVAEVLAASGHDPASSSLIICEGVLVYLDGADMRRTLSSLAHAAQAHAATSDSTLAVSLAIHRAGVDSQTVLALANARRRTARSEPWRTILPLDTHLHLISESGWASQRIVDAAELDAGVDPGRSVFVTAQLGPGPG